MNYSSQQVLTDGAVAINGTGSEIPAADGFALL